MEPNALKDLTIKARQVQWQYKLEDYSEASLKKLKRSVKKSRNELEDFLLSNHGGPVGRGRKVAVMQEMENLLLGIQTTLGNNISDAASYAGSTASFEYSNILSFDGKAKAVNMVALSGEQLKTMLDHPIGGHHLNTWVKKSFNSAMEKELGQEVLKGYLQGEGSYNMARRLENTFDVIRRDAETLALTYIAEANNAAIKSVYDANSDVIKKEEWSSVLEVNTKEGRGTCLRCAALDGRQFPLDEPHVRPPLHPRCRCFMLPVTVSYRELGLDVDEIDEVARSYQIKKGNKVLQVGQYNGKFEDWLFKQPKKYQVDLLGPNRLRLIDEGKIKFENLIDKHGNLRLLKRNGEGVYTGLMPKSNVLPVIASAPIATPIVGIPNKQVVGDVSNEFMAEVTQYYSDISPKSRKLLEDEGVNFVITSNITEAFPELKGVRPRGWSLDSTWDDVVGMYRSEEKKVVIAEKCRAFMAFDKEGNIIKDAMVRNDRIERVIKHEAGHAVDNILGVSKNPRFQKAYILDKENLFPSQEREFSYFLQEGEAGGQETVAQCFSHLMGDNSYNMKEVFPNCFKILQEETL